MWATFAALSSDPAGALQNNIGCPYELRRPAFYHLPNGPLTEQGITRLEAGVAHRPACLPGSLPTRTFQDLACMKRKVIDSCLSIILPSLSLLLALAGNDFDPLRLNSVGIIKLELNILDNERPDFVAEAVGVEVSL
jgi:hypothetical protein